MAVVPFIFANDEKQKPSSTVYDTAADYAKYNNQAILIRPFQYQQYAEPCESSNCTYDLRVGEAYSDHSVEGFTELPEGEPIDLPPGSAVIIQTEEYVQLPNGRFGQILPKVSLLKKGISNTTSKIDPGFKGNLIITVFNLGRRQEKLRRGDLFCSLVIQEVNPVARPYTKMGPHLQGRIKKSALMRAKGAIERNGPLVVLVASAVGILVWIIDILRGILGH